MYDQEQAEQLFLEVKKLYQDRGMMKWIGFYLSDHTAVLAKDQQKRERYFLPLPAMTLEEIGHCLYTAYHQKKFVSIQLYQMTEENTYLPDLTGWVSGYQDTTIYLNDLTQMLPIDIETIRHIQLIADPTKLKGGEPDEY